MAAWLNTFHQTNVVCVSNNRSRNFAMNPKSGIKIGAFKNGAVSRHSDRELFHLAKYLLHISKSNDFKEHDHKNWKIHRKSQR